MQDGVLSKVVALQHLSVAELRQQHSQLFPDEHVVSSNKTYLQRQIAYRLQELAFGGLSHQAEERLQQLIQQYDPINPRDCIFNVEEFTYWDQDYSSPEALLRVLGDNVEFYGACDPSLGHDTMRGDYTAIIVLAKDRRDNLLYVLVADLARRSPTETIEAIFAYYQRYRFGSFAIETNQFQELLAEEVERRGQELGQYLPIERVKHTTENKIRRIQSLHPWVKNGAVRFSRKHTLLLEQCRFFPKGKHDDGPDALEMAVRAAEQGGSPMLHVINLNEPERNEDDEDGDARWINLD